MQRGGGPEDGDAGVERAATARLDRATPGKAGPRSPEVPAGTETVSAVPPARKFQPPAFPEELVGASALGMREAEAYVQSYRDLQSAQERSDLLAEARGLDLEDYSVINELLVSAAVQEDALVREAAHTALREYGGERAAELLERYLEFHEEVPDRGLLGEIVEFMRLPEADLTGRGKRAPGD